MSTEQGRSLRAAALRALRTHGVWRTLTRVPHYLDELQFDYRNGLRTAGVVEVGGRAALDGSDGYYAYAPMNLRCFARALRAFRVPTTPAFVDFGCGKGRVLILALRYGFSRVVGVDLVSEFCRTAEANLKSYRSRTGQHADTRVLCLDASAYPIDPWDGVFFLNNPFPAKVVRLVLGNIKRSVLEHPRDIWVVYAYPMHADVFDEDPFWVKTDSRTCAQFGAIDLYRVRSPG